MNKLVLAIKLFNSRSNLEKVILRIIKNSSTEIPDPTYIDTIVNEINEPETQVDSLSYFLDILKKQKDWLSITKLLLITNVCLVKTGKHFREAYLNLSNDLFQGLLEEAKELSLKEYTHRVLINSYHKYMLEFAKNYDILKECRAININYLKKVIERKDLLILEDLLIMANILKFCLKQKDNVITALGQKVLVTKMIAALLLQDCIEFYNILHQVVKNTISQIFEVETETAFYLDALYTDLIKCTKPMKEFLLQKTDMIDLGFANVELYKIDVEFNKKEEKYIETLKCIADPRQILHRQSIKGSTDFKTGIRTKVNELEANLEYELKTVPTRRMSTKNTEAIHTKNSKENYFSLDGNEVPDIFEASEPLFSISNPETISNPHLLSDESPEKKQDLIKSHSSRNEYNKIPYQIPSYESPFGSPFAEENINGSKLGWEKNDVLPKYSSRQ